MTLLRLRNRLLFITAIIGFLFTLCLPSYSWASNYIYDSTNRLIRVEYDDGSKIEYTYDASGNRTQRLITSTTANPVLQVTVRRDAQNTLPGINVYLFNDGGSYLGKSQASNASGVVSFEIPKGNYKVRADYLGYQFWSDVIQVTAATSIDLTIPHHTVNITVSSTYQGTSTPITDVPVYLFTPAGSYLSLNQKTGNDGKVSFLLPDKDYKVRADYLSRQYFSSVFNAQDTVVNVLMADTEITVTQESHVLSGIHVYVFAATGAYLGINNTTNESGKVTFRLPVGSYKFRADYLSSQYWSSEEALTADQLKAVTINTGGGTFTLTVLKGDSDPLTGVKCYAFTESGTYINLSGTTNSSGQVSYDLSNGNYRFRVDYLGYQFWSDVVTVPTTMIITRTIAHQNVNVTVQGSLAGNVELKTGVPVYLFSPSGTYLSMKATTDSSGLATFSLPQQAYKVRADYLGQQFWSEEFTWANKTVVIPEGTAHIHVTGTGLDLSNVPVYVFSSGGSYLSINGKTDTSGIKDFRLPAGSYKFRADYQGNQYWATATISQDMVNTVALSTGGGQFTLTIDTGSGPLTGVKVYVFNSAGSYLSVNATSNTTGQVTFNLADGNYKFRVDYLGYQFWTDVYNVPTSLSGNFSIPHQNSIITVQGVYQGSLPLAGVKVYLFTQSGSYLSQTQTTNASGQVTFSLPNESYKVRVDYLGSQFWSDAFQFANATVSIQQGIAQITAKKAGNTVAGLKVYLYSEAGSYLSLNATTNTEGIAEFLLPNRSYKFRVDEGSTQHWSAVTTITEGQVNPIEVDWN